MQEAESVARFARKVGVVRASGFKQAEGAIDVGAQKGFGAHDGAVDVRLCGEVDDGARAVLAEDRVKQVGVADVAVHKAVATFRQRRLGQRRQVLEITGVGKQVQIDERSRFVFEPVEHEVCADKAGTAGDQDRLLCVCHGVCLHQHTVACDPRSMRRGATFA